MTAGLKLLLTADAVGGVWQYSLDLAAALARHGVEPVVAVLGPALGSDQRAEASAAGVRLVETGLPLDWLCDGPAPVVAAGEAIADLARAERADLIQLNMPTLGARARMPAPVVAVAHGCVATWWEAAWPGQPLDAGYRWHRTLTGEGLATADAVIAPTAGYAATVARHYGIAPPVVVHNGRRPTAAPGHDMAEAAFTCGRLWDRVKATALLDRVAAGLPVPLRAAGPLAGPHGETVAPAHLEALGVLGGAEIARRMAARPVFVSAASFEPFGLAVLEAAAAGCPLVLSDLPGFRELWDGAARFVVPGHEAGFAAAIRDLLADPAALRRAGDAASVRARRYTPERMATAMLGVYRTVRPAGRRAA